MMHTFYCSSPNITKRLFCCTGWQPGVKWDIMSVCDKNMATVNNSQFRSWHLSSKWKWMGKWPALYRPSSGCVTGWMMQIEDNISAILNGITPNLMSLKGWVLALLSEGGGVGCSSLTDTQIKCSDREHNKVIRDCDMSVRGDEGMNCHSLSEPILSLIHDVPYTTVGKQDSIGASNKYLFRWTTCIPTQAFLFSTCW